MDKFGFDEVKEYRLIPELLFFQEGPGVRNTQYTDSGVKLLNVANLVDGKIDLSTSDRYISEEEAYGKYAHFLVEDGDFIIASSGIKVEYFEKKMGFVSANQLPLCMNTSTIRFRTLDENVLNIRYFMYYLKSESFKLQLEKQITGSAQLNFGPSHLKKMYVPVVGLESQKAICKKLDKINRVLELKRNQIDELDTLIKARFVEMFGDPIQNEKNWSRRSLEQLCHSIVDCPHSTPNYISEDTGFMCIRTSIVKKNKILWDEIEYIVEDEFNQRIQRKRPEKGDIVYTREGAILGIAAIIDRNCNVALGQRSMLLSPDSSVCTSEFICTAMNSDSFLSNALRGISGSASPHINVGDIKSFEMIAPPLELQRKFSEFNSQVDKLKVEVQSIFLNCGSRSIFRYAQSIKGCKIEKYERRCSFDTKRECHRGNEKKWWICYLSAIKSDC